MPVYELHGLCCVRWYWKMIANDKY